MSNDLMDAYMKVLGSADPVPGGGAATAITGAQATSLMAMVAKVSIKKDPSTFAWQDLINSMETKTLEFMQIAADDQRAFAKVMAVYKAPKNQEGRSKDLQIALLEAATVPTRAIELAWACQESQEEVVQNATKHVVSDAGIAYSHLKAVIESSLFTVKINLNAMKHTNDIESIQLRLKQIEPNYQSRFQDLMARVHSRITQ